MRKLAHPNLVHMYDVVIDLEAEDIFLVLEFVDGGWQKRGAISSSRSMIMLRQISRSLRSEKS